jgi:hypothetical protein
VKLEEWLDADLARLEASKVLQRHRPVQGLAPIANLGQRVATHQLLSACTSGPGSTSSIKDSSAHSCDPLLSARFTEVTKYTLTVD